MLRFRCVYIFGVSQTDGQPLPHRVSGDPRLHIDRLRQVIAERGITLDDADGVGV